MSWYFLWILKKNVLKHWFPFVAPLQVVFAKGLLSSVTEAGRSAVGPHGLCSRLLSPCAICPHLCSHVQLLSCTAVACIHVTYSWCKISSLGDCLEPLRLKASARAALRWLGGEMHCPYSTSVVATGYLFEYLWVLLLSPGGYWKEPCCCCLLAAYRSGHLPCAAMAGWSWLETFQEQRASCSRGKLPAGRSHSVWLELGCWKENLVREVLRSGVEVSAGGRSGGAGTLRARGRHRSAWPELGTEGVWWARTEMQWSVGRGVTEETNMTCPDSPLSCTSEGK